MKANWGTCWALAPVVLLALDAANAATPRQRIELPGYEGLPLERGAQNHLVLHATVNGRPANFLIDTGAAKTFLRADRARNLGLEASAGSASVDLRASPRLFGRITVALYDPSQGAGYLPADGTIALDMLRQYKAVINCRSKQIFFATDPSRRLNLARIAVARGFVQVPIQQDRRGYLNVPCSIRRKAGRLSLDTGAFLTMLDEQTLSSLGITGSPTRRTAGGFDGRVHTLQLAQIDDLKIGPVPIPPQRLAMTNITPERRSRKDLMIGFTPVESIVRRDAGRGEVFFGLLGNDLLDYQQAIIDLESMSLFLK